MHLNKIRKGFPCSFYNKKIQRCSNKILLKEKKQIRFLHFFKLLDIDPS